MSSNFIMTAAVAAALASPINQPTPEQVLYLLHFNDAVGTYHNKTFVDEKGHAALGNSSASIASFQSPVSGLVFSKPNTGYVSLPLTASEAIGTQDFTIEMWICPTQLGYSSGVPSGLFSLGSAPGTNSLNCLSWLFSANGQMSVGRRSATYVSSAPGAIQLGKWTHVAVTRQGTLITLWIDGKRAGEAVQDPTAWNLNDYATNRLGYAPAGANGPGYNGYVDELRMVRGLAVYQEEFTPPTEPFTL